jgi:XRE family transcriptional regulator, regulator of sulfur utilization
MTTLGDLIRRRLKDKGWSQADLADKIGTTSSQVSRIISGERGTTIEVLEKLARVLGVPINTVFRAAAGMSTIDEKDDLTERAEHLIKNYKYLETKEKALEYLDFLAIQEDKAEYRVTPSSKPAKETKSR